MQPSRHFEVQLKRSGTGQKSSHKATLRGLGLTRMGKVVYCKDTPAVRGMLYKVVHLVTVQPRSGEMPPSKRQLARAT